MFILFSSHPHSHSLYVLHKVIIIPGDRQLSLYHHSRYKQSNTKCISLNLQSSPRGHELDLAVTRIGSSSCPLRDIIAEIRFLASTYLSYMTIVTYLKWDFWKQLGFCPNQGGGPPIPRFDQIFSKTKSGGGGAVSLRSFNLLNSMIYDLKRSVDLR